MKTVGIITIYDNGNFGNRLQNYATQETIKKLDMKPVTLKNLRRCNVKADNIITNIKLRGIFIIKLLQNKMKKTEKEKKFEKFNKKYINLSKKYLTSYNAKKIEKLFDYFIVGSDQVWNPRFKRMEYIDLLGFTKKDKKISFAASFGINELNSHDKEKLEKYINDFKAISVRENEGKNILKDVVNNADIQVLLDPTMLLDENEWNLIAKKPNCLNSKKYILLYFLGQIEEEWRAKIEKLAIDNDCDIINVLDKNSEYYNIGPDEFIYLEKNAFYICTDSFHSTVFAILYKRPFTVFERITKVTNLNSRVDTLLNKFKLEGQKFDGDIKFDINYEHTEKILNEERKRSIDFLLNACKDEENNES